jgi:hypothetical protein
MYDWIAIFDCDEFLSLKKHNNIKDFLSDYSEFSAIGINWVLFGNNNQEKVIDNEYSLLKRFTKRQISVNPLVKSIIRPIPNIIMDVHIPRNFPMYDANKNPFSSPFNTNGKDDIAQLNHYFCKTQEEFREKVDRGRADVSHKREFDEFYLHNFNEVEDLHAYNFLYR